MAAIPIWYLKFTQGVGHIAIELHGSKVYISHWPDSVLVFWAKGKKHNETLEADIWEEGREPDAKMYIPPVLFDEEKCLEWWNDFISSPKTYNLLTQNCAHVVEEAFETGLLFRDELKGKQQQQKLKGPLSPGSSKTDLRPLTLLETLCKSIIEGIGNYFNDSQIGLRPSVVFHSLQERATPSVVNFFTQLTVDISLLSAAAEASTNPNNTPGIGLSLSDSTDLVLQVSSSICSTELKWKHEKHWFKIISSAWDGEARFGFSVIVLEELPGEDEGGEIVRGKEIKHEVIECSNIKFNDSVLAMATAASLVLPAIDHYYKSLKGKRFSEEQVDLHKSIVARLFSTFMSLCSFLYIKKRSDTFMTSALTFALNKVLAMSPLVLQR